jgi:peptide-methionine (S)-S-oxide reductase
MSAKIVALTAAVLIVGAFTILWAGGFVSVPEPKLAHGRPTPARKAVGPPAAGHQQATLGGGCFWCTEAVFQQVNGVQSVVSGYSGGSVKDPTYEAVCTGKTGHAEVIQIAYDPAVVSFAEILEVFWKTHDPTTLNRQGADKGPQYRSVVFYHTDEQKQIAEQHKQKLDAARVFDRPIVTEIVPFTAFYAAEAKHQNFYLDNPRQPYCSVVIRPKLEKLEKVLKEMHKLEPGGK